MKKITNVLADGEIEECNIYSIYDFPYSALKYNIETCRKKNITYITSPSTFDIETTACNNEDEHYSYMYIWQFSIQKNVVIGRTWEEFTSFFSRLGEELELTLYKRLVVYVHFLSFEFMFMKDFLHIEDIFAKEKRKVLKLVATTQDKYVSNVNKMRFDITSLPFFEFRCSFFLSNMSLQKFCENSKLCKHYKLNGEIFDYSKKRTCKTELTEYELTYCYNDVVGLEECIIDRLLTYGDTLATIPLTATSYVRREMRKACLSYNNYHDFFLSTALSFNHYKICRAAFRGGNTHANRYYTGVKLKNVGSFDLCSSYPSWMIMKLYPITKFYDFTPVSFSDLLKKCAKKAVVFSFKLINVKLKEYVPVPYMDVAHCAILQGAVNDNGRVISCDMLEYTCTDVDFRIILNQYTFESFYYIEGIIAEKGYLPKPIRDTIMSWYTKKTQLKGLIGKEYEYMKSKNDLNSTYGMMVSDILHSKITYEHGEWCEKKINDIDGESLIDSYYKSRNNFLPYQFGIYVTAYARDMLQRMIDSVSWKDFVYCDTDSIKLLNTELHLKSFKDFNDRILAEKHPNRISAKDSHGKDVYLGVWEYEGIYDVFITFGAKKYAFVKDGKIGVTVAGLSKEKGANELEKGRGLDDFYIGKTFNDSGRTTAYFNEDSIHEITINGATFTTASNIGIEDTTYTLGVTNEYAEIIYKAQKK